MCRPLGNPRKNDTTICCPSPCEIAHHVHFLRRLYGEYVKKLDAVPVEFESMTEKEKLKHLFPTFKNWRLIYSHDPRANLRYAPTAPWCLPPRLHHKCRVAKYHKSRDKQSKMACTTLQQYRQELVFWAERSRQLNPDIDPIDMGSVFTAVTNSMSMACKKYQLSRVPGAKAEIGLAELRLMMELDMTTTMYIDVAEQHHAAWCIGRVCAVRGASIGAPPEDDEDTTDIPYLAWRDIDSVRLREPGKFMVTMRFRNLKSNPKVAPTGGDRRSKGGMNMMILTMDVNPPKNPDNLIFSVPHRLLAIAIRRKLLEGIETVEDLLNGDLQFLTIKPDHLDDPVFYNAKEKGAGLTTEPLRAAYLTPYLKKRAALAGFEGNITWYAIRRRSAAVLARSVGNDTARAILNHSPNTKALEQYYLNTPQKTDVTAISHGEGQWEDAQQQQEKEDHVAIMALPPARGFSEVDSDCH